MPTDSLGTAIRAARAAHGLSLQQVAERAGCSPGYVHKLEMDRVRTPSPRVLAGLAEALGLPYDQLMGAAGYEPLATAPTPPAMPGAIKRYSNAHIVKLLEEVQRELAAIRELLATTIRVQ
ncbi:MAG: helix-turn-helix transcriptional regulator [Solirubrobacterales bacterium]|nr:helix-turn-helix transcriptional regulator [Solirubrobacterales bacterium]MBV9799890.1 helix-turn-helix transcriptional regulator [Solirubrobacterales bacterium]